MAALVGCELRHHYIFDNLINRFFEGVEFEKTVYLRFTLANGLFLKRFPEKELVSLTEQDLDKEQIYALYKFVKSTNEIIPNELDKSSPEYLSYRYNTPAWIIRMWQKQYGKGVVFKTLKVNYRQSVPSIRVNEKKIDIDEFLEIDNEENPSKVKIFNNGLEPYLFLKPNSSFFESFTFILSKFF